MRQLLLAAGALCAAGVLAHATAQNQPMPGQVVGTTFGSTTFHQVGTQFPQAAPRVGKPVNVPEDTPLMRRYDPNRPFDAFKGTNIDPRSIVAPVQGVGDQTALERFYDKVKSAFGITPRGTTPPPPNVTPGIFRRNRERARERMWRWD